MGVKVRRNVKVKETLNVLVKVRGKGRSQGHSVWLSEDWRKAASQGNYKCFSQGYKRASQRGLYGSKVALPLS